MEPNLIFSSTVTFPDGTHVSCTITSPDRPDVLELAEEAAHVCVRAAHQIRKAPV